MMNFSEALSDFKKHQSIMAAYGHVMGVTYLDASTAAPKGSYAGRGQAMGILSQITYDLSADPKNAQILEILEANADQLDPQTKREVEVARKGYDQIRRIPADEYVAYSILINDAEAVWEKAKNESDFELFAPYLQQIVDYNRKFAGYYDASKAPYDALLNEFEEGLNMQTLDGFFARLRSAIVPLVEKIGKKEAVDDSFLHRNYPLEQQKKFSEYLMEVLGLDRNYCGIAESEHPFTTNFNNKDVRITTHYYENAPTFSIFSVIHEGGHALYELGSDDRYNYTNLSGGVSMGFHESQSRFYENLIGRSLPFIRCVFPKLQELFPEQLEGVDAERFYRAVNKAQPSLIRTESDELTYCLHIMIRYEIEKKLIDGSLAIKDVPAAWNGLYKEYLGVDVPDDKNGCLQDSHWAGGMIGYFPSYALGSAYGPQILHRMEQDLGDIYGDVAAGDLSRVTGWLREHIHRHASFKKADALFRELCGEFDAVFYTDYLTKKYSELYDL